MGDELRTRLDLPRWVTSISDSIDNVPHTQHNDVQDIIVYILSSLQTISFISILFIVGKWCCLIPNMHFSETSWQEHVIFNEMMMSALY